MTNLDRLSKPGKPLTTIIAAGGSFLIGILIPDISAKLQLNTREIPPVTSSAINQQANSKENKLEITKISPILAKNIDTTRQKLRELELKNFQFSVPKRFQGKTVQNITLKNKQKVIALTFDDGPWKKTTEQILDILKTHNIKATFFVVGQYLNEHQEIGKKIVEAGHVIANHTWNHPDQKSKINQKRIESEIESTAKLIYQVTGKNTKLFRPPGGVLENGLADYVKERKHTVVLWSADSVDWYYRSAPEITKRVLNKASNGGIVLLHDGGGPRKHVVEALPKIISGLKKQGYEFVTIPELLTIKDRELNKQELAKQQNQNQ
ncbi:MAG: polysaccharide deacetylase family protein [Trichodesmium sp. MAG_R01]|nr:polysaccharide deacetylase family protein [Trichodesmium sp. MAG_R01]